MCWAGNMPPSSRPVVPSRVKPTLRAQANPIEWFWTGPPEPDTVGTVPLPATGARRRPRRHLATARLAYGHHHQRQPTTSSAATAIIAAARLLPAAASSPAPRRPRFFDPHRQLRSGIRPSLLFCAGPGLPIACVLRWGSPVRSLPARLLQTADRRPQTQTADCRLQQNKYNGKLLTDWPNTDRPASEELSLYELFLPVDGTSRVLSGPGPDRTKTTLNHFGLYPGLHHHPRLGSCTRAPTAQLCLSSHPATTGLVLPIQALSTHQPEAAHPHRPSPPHLRCQACTVLNSVTAALVRRFFTGRKDRLPTAGAPDPLWSPRVPTSEATLAHALSSVGLTGLGGHNDNPRNTASYAA
ncbi:hypothetical protein LA080_012632 [Diaporthe eres]|nr:hypothetical protein LA080_012632 [Diaporthe eres]